MYRDKTFEIELPEGWSKYFDRKGESPRDVGFSDRSGLYLKVLIWPAGEMCCHYSSDATWRLTLNQAKDGFIVVRKSDMCEPLPPEEDDGSCLIGNGQLDIYALVPPREGESRSVGGNDFGFQFGFTHAEQGVETDVFERMIETLRAA